MEKFLELRLFRHSKPKKQKILTIKSSLVESSAIHWADQYINPNWDYFQLLEYMGHKKDYGYGVGYMIQSLLEVVNKYILERR